MRHDGVPLVDMNHARTRRGSGLLCEACPEPESCSSYAEVPGGDPERAYACGSLHRVSGESGTSRSSRLVPAVRAPQTVTIEEDWRGQGSAAIYAPTPPSRLPLSRRLAQGQGASRLAHSSLKGSSSPQNFQTILTWFGPLPTGAIFHSRTTFDERPSLRTSSISRPVETFSLLSSTAAQYGACLRRPIILLFVA